MGVRRDVQSRPFHRRAEQRGQIRAGLHCTDLPATIIRFSGQGNERKSRQSIRRRMGSIKVMYHLGGKQCDQIWRNFVTLAQF